MGHQEEQDYHRQPGLRTPRPGGLIRGARQQFRPAGEERPPRIVSHAHAQSAQQEMESPETVQTHQDGQQHGCQNRLQDLKERDRASEAISMLEKHSSAQATIHCAKPIMDCSQKIKQQVKCYVQMTVPGGKLTDRKGSHLDSQLESPLFSLLQAGLTECNPIFLGHGSSVGDCQLAARE